MGARKMLGRLGWHGQCSCCNGPRGKRQEKRAEERQWRRDQVEVTGSVELHEHDPACEVCVIWKASGQ